MRCAALCVSAASGWGLRWLECLVADFLIVAFNQRLEEVSHVLLGDYGNAGVNVLLTEILALHGVNGSLNTLIAHDLRVLSHNGA